MHAKMDSNILQHLFIYHCILILSVESIESNLNTTLTTTISLNETTAYNETNIVTTSITAQLTTNKTTTTAATTITNSTITTTSPTTTITTTTTTTTMKPCPRMKFISRARQASPEVITVVGSSFSIDCSVTHDGGPEPDVYWYKDEVRLDENSFRTFSPKSLMKAFKLVLDNVDVPDDGKYKCTVDNKCSKSITNTVNLVVRQNTKILPKIKELSPKNPSVYVDESITFYCKAQPMEKMQTPFIKWTRQTSQNLTEIKENDENSTLLTTTTAIPPSNDATADEKLVAKKYNNVSYIDGDLLYQVTDLKIEQGLASTLTIPKVSEKDEGVYTCLMVNPKGVVKESTTLNVSPVPPLSKKELEDQFVKKYGKPIVGERKSQSFAILIALSIFITIGIIMGCLWWYGREKEREKNRNNTSQPTTIVVTEPPKSKITIDPALDAMLPDIRAHSELSISHSHHHSSKRSSVDHLVEVDEKKHLLGDDDEEFVADKEGKKMVDEDEWDHVEDACT